MLQEKLKVLQKFVALSHLEREVVLYLVIRGPSGVHGVFVHVQLSAGSLEVALHLPLFFAQLDIHLGHPCREA